MTTFSSQKVSSNLPVWDIKSSIRSRPRRLLNQNQKNEYFFPINRQPLAIHPLIQQRGQDAIRFILTQTVYKFMYDIAILETELINKGALIVANDQLQLGFPSGMRHDALSIIIDEAYHAYVAIDYINQVEELTGVKVLNMSNETTVKNAIKYVETKIPEHLQTLFYLIAVSISEHVLTKDLISIGKDTNVGEFFRVIMADHVLDEGRHAVLFANILNFVWEKMQAEDKKILGPILPEFMREYLRPDLQKSYDESILQALGLPLDEIQTIMSDTHINACNVGFNSNNPVIINLITLLQRLNILEHSETKRAFTLHRLI